MSEPLNSSPAENSTVNLLQETTGQEVMSDGKTCNHSNMWYPVGRALRLAGFHGVGHPTDRLFMVPPEPSLRLVAPFGSFHVSLFFCLFLL